MSATDTDVIVTEYRAEFRAEPFSRPRWTISGGMEYRTRLPKRRRHTVAAEYAAIPFEQHRGWGPNSRPIEPARKVPDTGIGHVHESMLLDPDAVIVFVPNEPGSRFGRAVLLEQIPRDNRCKRCAFVASNGPELASHIFRIH